MWTHTAVLLSGEVKVVFSVCGNFQNSMTDSEPVRTFIMQKRKFIPSLAYARFFLSELIITFFFFLEMKGGQWLRQKIHNDLSNLPHDPQQSYRFLSRVKQGRNNSWRVTRPDCQCWRRVDSPGANPPRGRCHFHGSFCRKALATAGGLALSSWVLSLADTFWNRCVSRVSKGRRQTSPPSPFAARPISEPSLDSTHDPLCGPGGAEAGGYVLIDEPGGLLSISTNYDKRLHVCGISECRCVKLTLMNPFVYFSCCCFFVNVYWAIKTWMFHNISGCLM